MSNPTYEKLLRQAGVLKLRGLARIALGDDRTPEETREARQALLKAASFELQGLASLDDPDLLTVERHLLEALGCLKGAVVHTGWLPKLPNPPWRRR